MLQGAKSSRLAAAQAALRDITARQLLAHRVGGRQELVHAHVLSDFAKADQPWLAALIDALRPVFAAQMAKLVRVHHRSRFLWPESRADINERDEDGEDDGNNDATDYSI